MTVRDIRLAARSRTFQSVAIAIALTALAYLLQANYGFGNWDEGYLWYGAQQTAHGAVPIRDFMAYDIGRYYWAAGVMAMLRDDGMLTLRFSAFLFQIVGMAAAAWCMARVEKRSLAQFLGLAVVLLWMWPWFRAFDCAATLILLGTIAWLLTAPTPGRLFVGGVMLGLMAIIGRNHGAYGAFGMFLAVIIGVRARDDPRGLGKSMGAWLAGIALGYSPMLVLLAADAGFRTAFIADNLDMLQSGATNIALPVPWPHLAFSEHITAFEKARKFLLGVFFVALPLFVICGAIRLIRLNPIDRQRHAVFAACVLLALPYAHFAFSRADFSHMASGIAPLLLGLLAWPDLSEDNSRGRGIVAAVLLCASLPIMAPLHPGVAGRIAPNWVAASVGKDSLRMPDYTANQLSVVDRLLRIETPGSKQVFIAPYWSGLYAAFGLKSPVWEIYALFPRSESFQRAEIERIEAANVRVAVIQDFPLDGRNDLRYPNTHPLIYAYLNEHFTRAEDALGLQIFVRRVNESTEAKPVPARGSQP
jgi:hypothetical protein